MHECTKKHAESRFRFSDSFRCANIWPLSMPYGKNAHMVKEFNVLWVWFAPGDSFLERFHSKSGLSRFEKAENNICDIVSRLAAASCLFET